MGDSEPSNEITYMKPASAQQSLSNTPAEGEPRIDGIPEVGQTVSADTTAIEDADGLENAVFQYQWLVEDADIPGATGATYTVVSGDVGKAIRVSVAFTDDGGNEETLTRPAAVVTAAGLQLQSATVDGAILTLTYSEVLDTGVTLSTTAFAVNVNGSSRSLIGVGVGESNVLLLLSTAVETGDTVTVDYTVPEGPDFIRDTRGRGAASFSGQAVTNDTASPPLTASAHDAPSSPQRAGRVHLRVAVQRGSQAGLQLHDGAGPCFHRDRRRGHLCAPAGAGQERPLGDHRRPRLQRRRDHSPERHHRLLRPGRHLHGGRREAVQWASAGRSGAEHPGHRVAHHHGRRPGGGDPHR